MEMTSDSSPSIESRLILTFIEAMMYEALANSADAAKSVRAFELPNLANSSDF